MIKRICSLLFTAVFLCTVTACGQPQDEQPMPPSIPAPAATAYNISDHIETSDGHITLTSPSKTVRMTLTVENGQLSYNVSRNGQTFIKTSAMGLTIDNIAYGSIASLAAVGDITGTRRTDERVLYGRTSKAVGTCTEFAVPVGDMTVDVRLYDNTAAFRYRVSGSGERVLQSEQTVFHLPKNSDLWAGTEHVYYETVIKEYRNGMSSLDRLSSPATVELANNKGYAAILEGDLYDYPGMFLEWQDKGVYNAVFPSDSYTLTDTVTSAWRLIYLADDLNELVGNTTLYLVNDAANGNYDWVTPGRAAWSWITGRTTDRVTPKLIETYTDYAAKLGLEYNIIDEGWTRWSSRDATLKSLVAQGNTYNVGQILWTGMKAGEGYNTPVRSLADIEEYLSYLDSLGMAGGKIDFFVTEDTIDMGVNIYKDILDYAAKLELVVNFHGCSKPTGADATYPNELNREAILGLESMAVDSVSKQAQYFTTQPFTRNLAGHADFTPAAESAFHLAQLVLTDAPMQAIGSDPAVLLRSKALEMFKSIPTVWEQTVVLPESAIGKSAVYARKGSDASWYVGGINYRSDETTLTVALGDFLGDGTYRLELWTDGKRGLECETKTVTAADTITVPFDKNSGFILRLDRVTLSQYGGEIDPDTPITVTLADDTTVVGYTLDGSEPTASSPVVSSGDALPITDTCILTLKIMNGPDKGLIRQYRFNKLL